MTDQNQSGAMRHVHLDVLGGIAGDMFIAAILDARPDLAAGTIAAIRAAGVPEDWFVEPEPAGGAGLTGTRMRIDPPPGQRSDGDHHEFASIESRIRAAPLEPSVRHRALGILRLIVEAEAEIHGVAVTDVVLHEVGAIDSVADVVGAAHLIEKLSPASWSMSPLPVGGGFIDTAHGRLPVPAPATQLLLHGFPFFDDGIPGERITPTGAAILRYLEPAAELPQGVYRSADTGHGFGTKKLPGLANALRARCYVSADGPITDERVAVIEFVVDDQTPEDLAVGLEVLRDRAGVLEVLQTAVGTKKGRIGQAIQVLTTADSLDETVQACFEQTTTIGLRYRFEHRKVLSRREIPGTTGVLVKAVSRPGGVTTVKASMGDIHQKAVGHYEREILRRQAEAAPIDEDEHER
jgi:uncharacterized protein (TIGR00299 family) protein